MRKAFENFRIAATGRWAISIPTFLLIVPFGFLVAIERELMFNPESSLAERIMITSAGMLASFLYIFILQATLIKDRKKNSVPLWRCLFCWYSTGPIQGFAASIYAHLAFDYRFDFIGRMLMPTFYVGTACALLAFYFGTIERRRVEAQALQNLDLLLAVDKGEMISSDAQARKSAREALETVLKPQIGKLQTLLATLGSTSGRSDLKIQELSAKAREIAIAIEREANSVTRSRKIEIKKSRGLQERISLWSGIFPHSLSVRISILVIAFGAFTGQLPRNGWDGVIAGQLGALIIGTELFVLASILKRKNESQRSFFIGSYVLVFVTQMWWTYLQPRLGFLEIKHPFHPVYAALKTLYGVYVASVVSSLLIDTKGRFDESKVEHSQTIEDMNKLSRGQEVLEQHIFTTRFGSLQGKISGVIMALNLLESDSGSTGLSDKSAELIRNAQALLDSALVEISELRSAHA